MPKKNKKAGVVRIKGDFLARGRRFGIVVSEFNEYLTRQLLEGAVETLVAHGAREKDIRVVWVPGAFELPLAAKKLLAVKKLDAVIALAVVIRGQTKHFEQVTKESARGLQTLAGQTDVPMILGIIPALSEKQAIGRVGVKQMNKGREWALAAIQMASLMDKLDQRKK
ncbi:MAG: 6,7-dimethyl-8-ribityllumazine synthase [Candidatus Omnitrophica bacterium]|nr:6,7-dimethyl-8-ribityllumazine synthase [Candidatus Omnitrophota bacterium]